MMIKSDLIRAKLIEPSVVNADVDPSAIKWSCRKRIAKLRLEVSNRFTNKVYFSKVVLSDFSGVNILNVKYDTRRSMFGSFIKIIKSQKCKRNKGLDFIWWSNYFSFLLTKMRYLILIATQNPDFLQRSFRKFRFQGASYLYLSKKVIRGISFFSTYFGEFALDRGTFLLYSSNFYKFMELMYFLHSDNFYQDFIILKLKLDEVLLKDSRFLFFFQSVGFNKLACLQILRGYFIRYARQLYTMLSLLCETLSFLVLRTFMPFRFFLLKYVYIYASWKRLP